MSMITQMLASAVATHYVIYKFWYLKKLTTRGKAGLKSIANLAGILSMVDFWTDALQGVALVTHYMLHR